MISRTCAAISFASKRSESVLLMMTCAASRRAFSSRCGQGGIVRDRKRLAPEVFRQRMLIEGYYRDPITRKALRERLLSFASALSCEPMVSPASILLNQGWERWKTRDTMRLYPSLIRVFRSMSGRVRNSSPLSFTHANGSMKRRRVRRRRRSLSWKIPSVRCRFEASYIVLAGLLIENGKRNG